MLTRNSTTEDSAHVYQTADSSDHHPNRNRRGRLRGAIDGHSESKDARDSGQYRHKEKHFQPTDPN